MVVVNRDKERKSWVEGAQEARKDGRVVEGAGQSHCDGARQEAGVGSGDVVD